MADRLSLVVLAALFALTRGPFLYLHGFPDGDQQHIALGIWEAVRSGTGFHGARIYALAVSPGYYAWMFLLRPLYATNPNALFSILSALGAVAGLAAHVFLWLGIRSLWGRSSAWLVSLLWLFAPGWWEVTTFGHPSVFALCFLVASLFALFGRRGVPTPGRLAWSAVLFALSVLMRADMMLAGAIFPAWAWSRDRRGIRSLLQGASVPVAALLVWAVMIGAIHPVGPGPGVLEHFFSVVQFDPAVYRKELAILALGLGPVTAVVAIGAWGVCLARRRFRLLVITAALGLPALLWWIHVEGPFRHMLVVALSLLLPAAALAGSRSVRFAIGLALGITFLNQVAMFALHDRILAGYDWSYQAAPGERRWSTRAPLDSWIANHKVATEGVEAEARRAVRLADVDRPRILIVTPMPFRYEYEILSRGKPYRYSSRVDPGALWIQLESGGRTYLFLEGGPQASQDALDQASRAGRLRGFSICIPPDARPTVAFRIPPDLPEIELGR